jgi:hypothetical protein
VVTAPKMPTTTRRPGRMGDTKILLNKILGAVGREVDRVSQGWGKREGGADVRLEEQDKERGIGSWGLRTTSATGATALAHEIRLHHNERVTEPRLLKPQAQAALCATLQSAMENLHGGSEKEQRGVEKITMWLQNTHAPATVEAYMAAYNRVKRWLIENGFGIMPIKPFHFMLYMAEMAHQCRIKNMTKSNIDMACAAVSYVHELGGKAAENPVNVPLVRRLKLSIGRSLTHKGHQATPIVGENLKAGFELWEKSGHPFTGLVRLMNYAMMKEGLMRWSDLHQVYGGDVIALKSHMRVFVAEAKTDTKREGQWVLIIRTEEQWGAYALVVRWAQEAEKMWGSLTHAQQTKSPKDVPRNEENGRMILQLHRVPLMCRMTLVGGVELVTTKRVTYDQFLGEVKQWAQEIGLPAKGYSTHSLRRGGATDQKLSGIPDTLIMLNGRWKSQDTMYKYFDWSVEISTRVAQITERLKGGEQETNRRVGGDEERRSRTENGESEGDAIFSDLREVEEEREQEQTDLQM